MTIEDLILKAINEGKASDVKEVIGLLGEKFTETEIFEAMKRLENEEEIERNHNIPAHYSFIQYLTNADYNLWLYLVFLAFLGTSATIYLLPAIYPLTLFTLTMSLLATHRKFTLGKNFHIKHRMASEQSLRQ